MPSPRPVLPRRTAALLALALMASQPVLAQNAPPPTPVTVVTLSAGDVTLSSPLPGRVAASAEAEVRPQVGGIIQKRLFQEGSTVSEGDPLYQIDAATYEAAKAVAEASLAQAKAALKSAEIEYERQQELKTRNVVAQQNLDSAIAERDSAAAAVKVAEANLLSAEIDLERTQIRAPISGAVGLSAVSQGALVTSGQSTALTTIRALDPVYVDVTQAASDMLRWRRMGSGTEFSETLGQTVSLTLADGSSYEYKGELSAAEPYVNEDTGTIVLRLSFPNPDHFLLPGMYVQVEMPQGVVPNAVRVPQEAVTRDRRGRPMVLVVNAESVVEQRVLDVVSDQGTDWIVTGGVTAGERVIVAGLQKTAAGATVTPQEQGAEAAGQTSPQAAQPSE
ncbi:efflux RND transporter periplasmic adaptor subunit [Celeribacter persicus]|uniref:Membrane fusion protein (Multidrug efflux system) n=1 Tax=Celeribacter persicus TaxID=1651082 RepID=A0A2T5HCM1_9RHOB|nr:efflux RND transporter periplasmic adaptor subunit [Celeribacter persicus]PTQ69326.1 membrane fusion protein (multidrug efflux system) [Celeribacter persicus]